ncbi:THUMP-like domain-containing protein [Maribacter sp. 2304DJ31-5]|uniref:THUMP-like domain-containing protein n=1 Tax=Maribacter sp. 2304DJ31-5 TaxID=3386273 RepID=UPI0039BC5B18
MNTYILKKEVQGYISDNLQMDPLKLLFKKTIFPHILQKELVEQIESKARSKKKLPTWFSREGIYYPNKLNISQTSSETTAEYKSKLVNGETLADLTGGFGVDSYAFSKKVKRVFHLEKNESLSAIAKHNFSILDANTIETFAEDGIKFLSMADQHFDWLYIDPSRRAKNNEKVYFLEDCEPNVIEHLELFLSKSPNILIKTGPLLDISTGLKQLKHTREIHIVALNNEVKEVLWILQRNYKDTVALKTINIKKEATETFDFKMEEEKNAQVHCSEPLTYLYEPNSSILKAGAYRLIGERFGLKKLHQHSHLYTSNELISFPGRRFKIGTLGPYNKKTMKSIGVKKANITTRNFPYSVAAIRKKTKLTDGGTRYLFFTTNLKKELIVLNTIKVD